MISSTWLASLSNAEIDRAFRLLLSYALVGALSVRSSVCIFIHVSFAWLVNIISQELDSKAMNRTIRPSSFKALKEEESAIISKRK